MLARTPNAGPHLYARQPASTPFRVGNNILLCNRLGDTCDSRFCERIVDLARVSVQSTRAADVDNVPRLSVLDTEVGRRSPHNLERCCSVEVDNRVPLLVRHLVNDAVPCVACIVDDDVNLAVAKVCRLFDQSSDIGIVKDIAHDGDGRTAGFVDFGDDAFSLF